MTEHSLDKDVRVLNDHLPGCVFARRRSYMNLLTNFSSSTSDRALNPRDALPLEPDFWTVFEAADSPIGCHSGLLAA
jgi:hypothetical protein